MTETRSIQEWERLADLSLRESLARRVKARDRRTRNTLIAGALYLIALILVVGFLT